MVEGAPADQAGLMEGDHLVSIAGHIINDVSDVPGAVFFIRANQFASITVKRGEELMEFSVKALPRPEKGSIVRQTQESVVESVVAPDTDDNRHAFLDWTSGGDSKRQNFNRPTNWLDLPEDKVSSQELDLEKY